MQGDSDPPAALPAPALPSSEPRAFAHRLNNLLTVVLANAESALSGGDPAEMKRALEIIVPATHSMADLVRGFARSPASLVTTMSVDHPARGAQRVEDAR